MANNLLIQKINNTFWHRHNNLPLTDRAISDFQVSIDSNLTIVELDGSTSAQYPITNVTIQVDGGVIETFTNRIALINRLVALSYTPYIVNSGLTQDQINAIQSANVPSGSNPFATMNDVSGGSSLYLGQYLTQLAFETAHQTGVGGNFAWVLDPTESFYIYVIWDVVNATWVYDFRTQATIDEIAYLGTLIGNVPHLIATTTGNNTTSDIIVADDLNPPVPATDLLATYIKKGEVWLYKTIAGATTALRLLSTGFRFGVNLNQSLTVSAEAQTAQNTQTFQNKSGVIALISDIPVIGDWVDYSATSTVVGFSSFTYKSIKILKISSKIIFVKYAIIGISNSPNASFTVSDNALDDTAQFGTVSRAFSNGVFSVGMSYILTGSNVLQCFKDPQANNWSATLEKTVVGQMFIKIG